MFRALVASFFVGSLGWAHLHAGTPEELLRGQAPVLFTGAEGEDADDTLLVDGQPIRGDEIWLWIPAIDVLGDVDLAATGKFFRLWDSGPESGPDGNDDDDNGIRAMDFDPLSHTFLISYEDSTTTGFAFGDILDGDLMELTVDAVDAGAITEFTFTRLFSECSSGIPGCIGEGDLNAVMRAADGTLFFGSGASQTLQTDMGGTVLVGSSTLIHATLQPDPLNIGDTAFFEPTVAGCPVPFCPGIYTGQLRGVDLLATGELTFGTSGDYMNQAAGGSGVVEVGQKSDILAVPNFGVPGLGELEQRTAEVVYDGALFFQSPDIGDAEILAHDILDTSAEISALIDVIGVSSVAGTELARFLNGVRFRRGDANNDGGLDISDAIFLLAELFSLGTPAGCRDAADANDDGEVDIADAVLVLDTLFGTGTPVPAPGPFECGVDPSADGIGCDVTICP